MAERSDDLKAARPVSKYLEFAQVDTPGRKTEVWSVESKTQGSVLGTIAWYNRWRQYCFFPSDNVLFNRSCLRDIVNFIDQRMEAREVGA